MTDVALTPEDVASKRFTPVRGGGEGYNMEEVDTFLDHVEASLNAYTLHITQMSEEMARLAPFEGQVAEATEAAEQAREDADQAQGALSRAEIRNRDLQARSDELEHQLEAMRDELAAANGASDFTPAYVAPVATEPVRTGSIAEASVAAAKLLEHATVSAEAIKEEANTESREKLASAEAAALALQEEAEAQAAAVREGSEAEAARLREAAEASASAQAAELAEARTSALEQLENDRGVLSAQVEELRSFEDTVRTDLTAYLADLQSRVAAPLPHSDEAHSFVEDADKDEAPAEDGHELDPEELVEVIEEGAANERFEEEIHDIVEEDSETYDTDENGVTDDEEAPTEGETPVVEEDLDSEKTNED